MNLVSLKFKRYGKWADASFSFGRFNAIVGNNESGKSTMFDSIGTMLYGFLPKTANNHPYTSWDGGFIEFSSEIEREGGERIEVERRLRSSADGTMLRTNGSSEKIGNHPLPETDGVGRDLFRSLFHIDETELMIFDSSGWSKIRNTLFRAFGSQSDNELNGYRLRLPDEVLEDIDEDVRRLYSTRGNAKSKRKKVLADLKDARQALRDKEREWDGLRDQMQRRDALRLEVEAMDTRIRELDRASQELRQAIEERMKWERKHGLHSQILPFAGDESSWIDEFQELDQKLSERKRRLEEMRDEVSGLKIRISEERYDGRLVSLGAHWAEIEATERQLHESLRNERVDRDRIEDQRAQLAALPQLDPSVDIDAARASARANAEHIARRNRIAWLMLPVVLAAAVTAVFWWPGALIFGAVALLLGLDQWRRGRALRDARAAFSAGLGSDEYGGLYASPDDPFFEKVRLARTIESRIRGLETYGSNERAELQNRLSRFLSQFEVGSVEALRLAYGKACQARDRRAVLEQELQVRDERLAVIESEIKELKQRYDAKCAELTGAYRAVGLELPSVAAGIEQLRKNIQVGNQMDAIVVERSSEWCGQVWDRVKCMLPGDALNAFGELDEGALTVLQNELDTVRDQRDHAKRELTEIEVRFQQFQIDPDLHAHIRSLEEEDVQLEVEGKRLELFRALVTEAEEEYRRANQPEFIRQVGVYLDRITGGKYQTVFLEDERHIVIRNEKGSIVDAEKHLSLGTIQQIAFCLRLSLLDLVDREKRLPLLIDDAFAHWDEGRQRRGFELLASDLVGRQVFYGTPSRATSDLIAEVFAAASFEGSSFNQILIES